MGQISVNFQPTNNFKKFIVDFKNDTGLDASKSIIEYIAYFNARMTDFNYQLNHTYLSIILNEVDALKK